MDIFTVLLVALGLAMDAFAVSIAHGMTIQKQRVASGLKMATAFGVFQSIMPALGWLAGLSFIELISGFDHWLAFILLAVIGGRMVYRARTNPTQEKETKLTASLLLILAIATSIDALAVGLSFSLLRVPIATPVVVIGVVAFLLSLAGFYFGNKIGQVFEKRIQVIGGVVLIAIGIKILLEHLL